MRTLVNLLSSCFIVGFTLQAGAQTLNKPISPDTPSEISQAQGEKVGGNSSNALSEAVARQQVLDLGKEWVAAECKNDGTTLRRILDPKFIASFDAGKPYDKEAFIKQIVAGDVDLTASQTLTDETVVIDHDTAVVTGTDTSRGTEDGKPYTRVFRYTVTYIRRNGQWLGLAEHLVTATETKI